MTVFVLLAALLAVIAVLWLLSPFFRASRRARAGDAEQDRLVLAVLREQLAELDAELAAGRLDADAHARNREEIERRALEEVAEKKAQAEQPVRSERGWALALALLVPALAIAGYLNFGSPEALDPQAQQHGAGESIDPAELLAMVEAFEARLEQDPDNAEGWLMLARSHMWMRNFERAEKAFARLAALESDNPDVFAAWADAVWAQRGSPNAQTDELVGKALELDPDHLMSLQLAGTAAYQREDFIGAAAYWERALGTQQPGSEIWQDLLGIVNEARMRGGMGPYDMAELAAAPAAPSPLQVAGTIRIADELAGGLDPDAVVFVFARAQAGGPPLAALRMRVADLPADFSFAAAQLIIAGQEVPAQVQIGARISLSGSATPASGDIEGSLSETVALDARGVELMLDRRRP